MPVTPSEADALQRRRIRASRGGLLRWLPRDWKTPLALFVSLVLALAAGIKHTNLHFVFVINLHTVFVIATVVSLVWLIVSAAMTAWDAHTTRKDKQNPVEFK